ncbi:signal transduction histidine kinase [Motilibacter rhizosphaerae]|uniref:histidine kinase n=1 Tax=Motilibacter rhizosphaerae TaxID=598652 RepID=A0A4Q7NWQ3_9ACTN|nr:ATP-binding protein [Motilibacter rhizosphaerae]RZS91753.1 signal transduction histidine kinase [Motilibacter rhizosphaerae]
MSMPRLRDVGLRVRITAIATGVVAAGLVVMAVALVAAMDQSLLKGLEDSGRERARDVATLVEEDRLPDPVPLGVGTAVVQVLDGQGRVSAASLGGDRVVPLVAPRDVAYLRHGGSVELAASRVGLSSDMRLVGAPAGSGTVLVAVSAAEARSSVRLVTVSLVVLVPLLLVAFALLCWFVVGSALRPVEDLRAGAEALTGGTRMGRLPVPAGRDEVQRLAMTLNRMIDRLEQASLRQRAFVADAAHELRSPLASMRTQVEVTRAHPSSADWDETAEGVLEDVGRLTRLVDDLLLLARVDAAPAASTTRPVTDVAAVVAAVVGTTGGRVRVGCSVDGDTRVRAEPDALRRVVQNLVDNAVRHATSAVDVRAGRDGGSVVLEVTDDGPGVPEEDRERVFERFARLDDARSRDAGGTGLGLAIVRDLVTAGGGSVAFEAASTAVVRLPAADVLVHPSVDA